MTKKIVIFALALMIAMSPAVSALAGTPNANPGIIIASLPGSQASDEIKVLLNGTAIAFDQPPIIENGRTLVPLRAIFEALGASVEWEESTQTVTAVSGDVSVTMHIGKTIYKVNDELKKLDVAPQIVGGRTLVPARAVAESFGADVGWIEATNTVTITTAGQAAAPPSSGGGQQGAGKGSIQKKSFGTYTVPAEWSEATNKTVGEKYFYIKDGIDRDIPSNISVESGKNRYSEQDALSFRDAAYAQLLAQVSRNPDVSFVGGEGTYTEKGYILIIFTVEEENLNATTKLFYIVGDFKYVLLQETDFGYEEIADVDDVARSIVDSFEWADQ